MHLGGHPNVEGWIEWAKLLSLVLRKLFVTTLAAAIARLWPDVVASSVDPGWVPTRIGGPTRLMTNTEALI
jgi:hypothetical protein